MDNSFLFNKTYKVLGNAINITEKRQGLITSNVANIDTVGYKAKDLDFNNALNKAMGKDYISLSRSNKNHYLQGANHQKFIDSRESTVKNSNNEYQLDSVDIDKEMANLAENNLKYKTCAELLIKKFALLRFVIEQGGN